METNRAEAELYVLKIVITLLIKNKQATAFSQKKLMLHHVTLVNVIT